MLPEGGAQSLDSKLGHFEVGEKNFRNFCVKIYFDKKMNFLFFWCQKKIFPGFIRFLGSKTCFIWRIRSTDFSPTSSIKNCFLPKTDILIMAPNLVPPLRSDFDR